MSPQERKAAENEVILLKVLSGPTIIRYYNSFTEKNNLYIVMEYAEGGSLSDRINEKKAEGEHFTKDQLLSMFRKPAISIINLFLICRLGGADDHRAHVYAFKEYITQRYQVSKHVFNKRRYR